jgi:hypothetical protein
VTPSPTGPPQPASVAALLDPAALDALEHALTESPVIVELRLPSSPHPPERLIFNRFDALVDYVARVARGGDTLRAWRFDTACRDDNLLAAAPRTGDAAAEHRPLPHA